MAFEDRLTAAISTEVCAFAGDITADGEALTVGEFLRLVSIDLPNDGDKYILRIGGRTAGIIGDLNRRDCPTSEDLADDGERYVRSTGGRGD
jgi:hypothetical protein